MPRSDSGNASIGDLPPTSPIGEHWLLAMERQRLVEADQHIADGRVRVRAQRARVELLEKAGLRTVVSKNLLTTFELTLELMRMHRRMIAREIERLTRHRAA